MAEKHYGGCAFCRHLNEDAKSCDAYPNQIPISIFSGEVKHTEVLPGQKGNTVYEFKG